MASQLTHCRQDTWNSELIMIVSEKIDNGNTLISDDMITWILDLPAEQGRCAGPGGQLNCSVIK